MYLEPGIMYLLCKTLKKNCAFKDLGKNRDLAKDKVGNLESIEEQRDELLILVFFHGILSTLIKM